MKAPFLPLFVGALTAATISKSFAELINLESLTTTSYRTGQQQDFNPQPTFSANEGGYEIRMVNSWKRFQLADEEGNPLTASLTPNTVISFDVKFGTGNDNPEFAAIGLDSDNNFDNGRGFLLHDGSHVSVMKNTEIFPQGIVSSEWYHEVGGGWYRYSIPVGEELASYAYDSLFLISDDDGTNPRNGRSGYVQFRNVRVYENEGAASYSSVYVGEDGPLWWSEVDPDYGVSVIDPNIDPASVDHSAPANLGQAKWMAYRAWKTLEGVAPTIAAEVNTDLTGGASPILVNGWTPSNNPEDSISLLNLGQLKALSYPFYYRIAEEMGDQWVNDQLINLGLPTVAGDASTLHPDYFNAHVVGTAEHYYPWREVGNAGGNKAVANLGQLKLTFGLDFNALPVAGDSDGDGLSNSFESMYGLDPNNDDENNDGILDGLNDFDDDGVSNAQELADGTNPLDGDDFIPTSQSLDPGNLTGLVVYTPLN